MRGWCDSVYGGLVVGCKFGLRVGWDCVSVGRCVCGRGGEVGIRRWCGRGEVRGCE